MSTLVFDGDCAFCASSVRFMERLGLRADVVIPWQYADLAALGLTAPMCQEQLQWVDDGRISSGHEAVARLLLANGVFWRPLGRLLLLPPFSWLAARVYAWIADHRHQLPGGTPACQVTPVTLEDSEDPPTS